MQRMHVRTAAGLVEFAAALAILTLVTGCGGGGSGPTPDAGDPRPRAHRPPEVEELPVLAEDSPNPPGARFAVYWSARNEAAANTIAPSSALSFVLTLKDSHVNGGDYVAKANRAADADAYLETYILPERRVVNGPTFMGIHFYAGPDGSGDVVGVAMASVNIQGAGTVVDNVTTTGMVDLVEVMPDQWVQVNETKPLQLEVRSTSGDVLAVSPGSVFWRVVDGRQCLAFEGLQAKGKNEGTARVVATVDGVESAPAVVRVGDPFAEMQHPELKLDKIGVGIVHLSNEPAYVEVTSTDAQGNFEPFTATSQKPHIAGLTVEPPVNGATGRVKILGKSYGRTWVNVESASGLRARVRVTVYDPHMLSIYDEVTDKELLRLMFTNDWDKQFVEDYDDWGATLSTPDCGPPWHAIGSYGLNSNSQWNISGKKGIVPAVLLYDPQGDYKTGEPSFKGPIAYPLDEAHPEYSPYVYLGELKYEGGVGYRIWKPIAPKGYCAMGVVVTGPGQPQPDRKDVVCVREDLTGAGRASDKPLWRAMYGVNVHKPLWHSITFWGVEPRPGLDQAHPGQGFLCPQTMVITTKERAEPDRPVGTRTGPDLGPYGRDMNICVLKIPYPTLVESTNESWLPQLRGWEPPPLDSGEVVARQVLVPFTEVTDADYKSRLVEPEQEACRVWDNLDRLLGLSPFYRLERSASYVLEQHVVNPTSIVQDGVTVQVKTGISTEDTNTFSASAGVTLSYECGVEVPGGSDKFTCTFSYQFGYETSRSITHFSEETQTFQLAAPPRSAAALWNMKTQYNMLRHEGYTGNLDKIGALGYSDKSYAYAQYPDPADGDAAMAWVPLGTKMLTPWHGAIGNQW